MKKIALASVKSAVNVTSGTYRLRLNEPDISANARAGQFVNVVIPNCAGILWRRPFSVHCTDPAHGTFDLLFNAVGCGTRALKNIKPGEKLNILGPLGNTFAYSADLKEAILVAGGLGIAPFLLLCRELSDRQFNISLFYGVDTAHHFCCLDEFTDLGVTLHLTTEDGSKGKRGVITESLEIYLENLAQKAGRELFVCGPTPMLSKTRSLALDMGIRAQVSVENMMACGFGACMGCPVRKTTPSSDGQIYNLACTDGPVFYMDEICFDD